LNWDFNTLLVYDREMLAHFNGLLWLLLLLGPLVLIQRLLHRELQAVFLLLTRRAEIALLVFSLLVFPGVLLHETSHFIMARILRVRTGRFSVIPRSLGDGRLQLGFVETEATDILRDALIGAAPFLAGSLFVAYAGLVQLNISALWDPLTGGDIAAIMDNIGPLYDRPDFWLWFYLTFAVSSTMLPSASDRRAWRPLALVVGLLIVVSVIAGAGPWMVANLAPLLNDGVRAVAVILGISLSVHLIVLVPAFGLHLMLSRLTGMDVV
jgi:hypothetical protein